MAALDANEQHQALAQIANTRLASKIGNRVLRLLCLGPCDRSARFRAVTQIANAIVGHLYFAVLREIISRTGDVRLASKNICCFNPQSNVRETDPQFVADKEDEDRTERRKNKPGRMVSHIGGS
jgi:hypothetical protein